MSHRNREPRIYLLPNLMTAGNLLCGFLALTFIVQVVPDPTGSEGPVFSATDIEKIKNALSNSS